MKTRLAILLGVTLLQPAFAILPPLYESLAELKAILESSDLKKELTSGEIIEAIEKNESGYEIRTNHSQIQVDLHFLPQSHPGPAKFEIHVHPAEKDPVK